MRSEIFVERFFSIQQGGDMTSVFVKISSFMGLLEPPISSKELYDKAQKLCDDANDGMPEAVKIISHHMANEESPFNGFFAVAGSGLYVLTDLAEYESTRGASL
jgi:hypothetical protein